MYLPDDILDIIFEYKKQLDLIPIIKEYKKKVSYYYSSQHFSQINFNNNVVSFYKGQENILCKIKNKRGKINGIYFDSVITILK